MADMANQSQSTVPTAGPRRLRHDDYTVAIICPMGVELAPIRALLDEEHEILSTSRDQNAYKLGMMGQHNVIVAVMPEIGNNAAAMVITQLLNDFKRVRFGLLVGIGGGIPDEDYEDDELEDIRLGDVVVSESKGPYGGVVQFDRGKTTSRGFVRTGYPNKPPHLLASSVEILKTEHDLHGSSISRYLEDMYNSYPQMQAKYEHPGSDRDRLFQATYPHQGGTTCKKCDLAETIEREERKGPEPRVHYGTIGSSNMVIKDAQKRDELRDSMEIICVDMEAAGLMDAFPCLVVRGICDYADSHKQKKWQPYAASTAAAYTKELLSHIPPEAVMKTQAVTLENLSIKIDELAQSTQQVSGRIQSYEEKDILEWLSPKDIDFSSLHNQSRQVYTPGTGQWLLDDERYRDWRDGSPGLLWLRGAAGCGKTIICSTVIHDLQTLTENIRTTSLAYWYFRFDNISSQNISNMLRSIIRQLSLSPLPAGVRALRDRHKQAGSDPSLDELISTFHHTLHDAIGDVYVILDALDECPSIDKQGQRERLLQCIENVFNQTRFKLHLLITSRPEPDIRTKIGPISRYSFDIEDLVKADVEKYVDTALMNSNLGSWANAKEKIRAKLLSFGERRFRWAELQIRRFTQCPTDEDLEDALTTIPKSLEESYEKAFESILDRNRAYVRKIMMWLAVSLEPLTTEEVAAVVGFRTTDFLIHICTTLLVTIIDENDSDIIKLAHFSVKEFLVAQLQEEESWQWYRFSTNMAHEHVAYTALQALLEPDGELRPIFPYAARRWYEHATEGLKARSSSLLQNQINLLFDPNHTNQFLGWLEIGGPDPLLGSSYPENSQPLYYASLLDFEATVREVWLNESQLSRSRGSYRNALQAAAIRGHMSILRWILRNCEFPQNYLSFKEVAGAVEANAIEVVAELCSKMPHSELDQSVLEAAASNTENGQQVMYALLEHGDYVQITDNVVKAAAGNSDCGLEVMKLLLEKQGNQIQISEGVVEAAARNSSCGDEVIELLLEMKGEKAEVTEGIIKVAATHQRSPKIMDLLLRKGGQVHITEYVVCVIVENLDPWVATVIFERQGQICITERVVQAAARNVVSGKRMMEMLLKNNRNQIQITENVIMAAAGNPNYGEDVVELLLEEKGCDSHITEAIIGMILRYFNMRTIEVLFEKQGHLIRITEGMAKVAAGMKGSEPWSLGIQPAERTMQLLLDNDEHTQITEGILKAAVRNVTDGYNVLKLLLDKKGDQIQITDGILNAVMRNKISGYNMFKLLLDKKGDQIQITERLFEDASTKLDSYEAKKILELLLEKKGDQLLAFAGISNLAAAYGSVHAFTLLLEKKTEGIQITRSFIEALIKNPLRNENLMFLLRQEKAYEIGVDEGLISSILEHCDVQTFELLLDKCGHQIQTTDGLFEAAARNRQSGHEVMRLLFAKWGTPTHLTEGVLKAAARNIGVGDKVMELLHEKYGILL